MNEADTVKEQNKANEQKTVNEPKRMNEQMRVNEWKTANGQETVKEEKANEKTVRDVVGTVAKQQEMLRTVARVVQKQE